MRRFESCRGHQRFSADVPSEKTVRASVVRPLTAMSRTGEACLAVTGLANLAVKVLDLDAACVFYEEFGVIADA